MASTVKGKKKRFFVTGKREEKGGANTHYNLNEHKTNKEKKVTRPMGVHMSRHGKVIGCHVMKVKGKKYLRSTHNDDKSDNIDEQPSI